MSRSALSFAGLPHHYRKSYSSGDTMLNFSELGMLSPELPAEAGSSCFCRMGATHRRQACPYLPANRRKIKPQSVIEIGLRPFSLGEETP